MKNNTKGIILAGGNGSRLYPLTKGTSKQLLPVYDKPMIYYPLSTLMKAGIKEILIITTEKDLLRYRELFSDGKWLGLSISYVTQKYPNGIAEAFILGAKFIGMSNVCLILGDNIFHSENINIKLEIALNNLNNNLCTIFSLKHKNPERFGVIEFKKNKEIVKITEKPSSPVSEFIVSGIYFYTNDVIKISRNLTPSLRNELEITDINNIYIKKNKLKCVFLEDDLYWSDTGTYDSLLESSSFFYKIELEKGNKIACIEEIAYQMGYITKDNLLSIAKSMENSNYGKYLKDLIN